MDYLFIKKTLKTSLIQRNTEPSEEHPALQNMKHLNFSLFLGSHFGFPKSGSLLTNPDQLTHLKTDPLHTQKISVMHVIKLGFAPVSFPPG
jgi:hypothetical protein